MMDGVVAAWGEAARAGEPVEAVLEGRRTALRVIGRSLLSTDIDDARAAAFAAAVDSSLILLVRRNWSMLGPPLWFVARLSTREDARHGPRRILCVTIGMDHAIMDGRAATQFTTALARNLRDGLGLGEDFAAG
ncbi:MAG: hypothetical protein ACK4QW_05080 [Alphaproteobacteria bacterium]